MRLRSSFLAVTALAMFVLIPRICVAGPVTIFSDLTGTSTPGGYCLGECSPGNDFAIGAAFTVSGQSYALDQIDALLSFSSGTNDFVLDLWTSSGNAPGALMESWNLSGTVPLAPTSVTSVSSSLHPVLVAGQQYWLTLGMAKPNSVGVWWINDIGGLCCGEPGEVQGLATTSVNGGPFSTGTLTGVGFHAFDVLGTPTATPEPSSLLLLGTGLFGLGPFLRRRFAKS